MKQRFARLDDKHGLKTQDRNEDQALTILLLQHKTEALEAEIKVRRETEAALALRERELTDFLENANEAIHKVGLDGTILWANRAEMDFLGYSPSEYIGQPISKFHADADVIADILRRLTRGETLHNCPARLRHKDGSIREVAIHSSVSWDGSKFSHTKCFTRDMTAQKEETGKLERMVEERTAKLRETIAELDAFSYSVSHDLRSPLRAMQGYAASLLEDFRTELGPVGVDRLERIVHSSERLNLLIRDVLAYSKVSKGEIELKPISLDLLVREIIDQHPGFDRFRHLISIEPMPLAMGHEGYLTQCFTNLIDNAVKFVASGALPQVRIYAETTGEYVKVWVSDRGIGIAPEHHDRLFRIFGRIHPEKSYEGTGIGLAIVQKAVSRMGGTTGFTSECGSGSDFWFTLKKS